MKTFYVTQLRQSQDKHPPGQLWGVRVTQCLLQQGLRGCVTEPSSHPSLTINHRFAPTWTNPPEHLSKKWGWQGHTGILSNSNVFNTTAGTSASVHTVTPAMTLYTHTTPLKSVFYLSDCMMLLLALTTTAAFINLAGIIATLQGSPQIQKTLLIHHQRSYEAPSCTQPPLC